MSRYQREPTFMPMAEALCRCPDIPQPLRSIVFQLTTAVGTDLGSNNKEPRMFTDSLESGQALIELVLSLLPQKRQEIEEYLEGQDDFLYELPPPPLCNNQ